MIKVENLYFDYIENDPALEEINFHIEKGSWTSIIGHNGSGKSTLAKLLVGLLAPSEGRIEIDGLLLSEENLSKIRKKIGIVFQNPDNQFVGVTVKHDIAFGMENMQVPREQMLEKIDYYTKLVGLEKFIDKEPHQLSGGQKQRVAIAGALAMDQDILIFDEATSMLDPEGTNEVTHLIQELNSKHKKTVLTVTHDLSFAMKSDYCLILKDGKLIASGKPMDLLINEELLKQTQLEVPMELRLINDFKNNEKLVEELWQYALKK